MLNKDDFQEIQSALPGISVFAPKPPKKEESQAKSYTCPQCGGKLAYDLLTSGLACQHCGYLAAIRAKVIAPTADKNEFTIETMNMADKGWGKMRNLLHCHQCGAELSYPQGTVASSCPYCGSNNVNVTLSESNLFQPQALLPFSIKPDQLPQFTQAWMKDGWLHPSALVDSVRLDKFVPFYLPYWAFTNGISFDWEAEVAHMVSERYYDSSSKSWKTRQVKEWRWESGHVRKQYENFLVSGVNSKRLNPNLLCELGPFDMTKLVAFNPDYLVGINANAYDVDLNAAWAEAKRQMREEARQLAIDDAINSEVRNLSIDMNYESEKWRYLFLPVYIALYNFKEKQYQIMANGQTGKIFGQKPIDWTKVWLAIVLMILPGLLLILIGIPTMAAAGSGTLCCGLGLILLIVGITQAVRTYKKASNWEKL